MVWSGAPRAFMAAAALAAGGCYVGVDGATDPTEASAPSSSSDDSASASQGSASVGSTGDESTSAGTGVDPSDATGDASSSAGTTGDLTSSGDPSDATGDPTTSTTSGDPTTSTTSGDPTTSTTSTTTGDPTTTSTTTGGSTSTTGGADWDAAAQACVDEINMYRAMLDLPPYERWASAETCADGEAESDAMTNTPHGAFGECGEWAQNECPGWPAGDPIGSLKGCLAQMWAEGPGMDFNTHGHYINMSSTKYTKVACGFYVTGGNKLWAVQDFQ
ncbi:MAG: CAP domain-containing protein [Nannocystaceae bacterium]